VHLLVLMCDVYHFLQANGYFGYDFALLPQDDGSV